MDHKRSFQRLFDQEVDRRQFLGYLGAAALAVTGVTSVLKALGHDQASRGYGAGSYGGRRKSSAQPIRRQP